MVRKETEKRLRKYKTENNHEYQARATRFKEMIYAKGYEHAKGTKFRIVKANGEPFLLGKVKRRMIALTPTFCLAETENGLEEIFDLEYDSLKVVKEGLELLAIPDFYNIYDRRKTN